MVRRWLQAPIALSLVIAVLVCNGMAAQGVQCLMPGCATCAPKPEREPQGCCPKEVPAPDPCCCVASGDPHPDGVMASSVEAPETAWIAVIPEPIEWWGSQPLAVPPPEARALGPPRQDFHRAPCGRAPPAS